MPTPPKKVTDGSKTLRRESSAQTNTQDRVDATYFRAANEDDDGYDPYSDRTAAREPLFERDPWA